MGCSQECGQDREKRDSKMNGLELSELYWESEIKPFLGRNFPVCMGKIAVGLAGEGSECFGFDDEISRDHDWGVRVCFWMEHREYLESGGGLQKVLKALPSKFRTWPVIWTEGKSGVLDQNTFFRKYLGTEKMPMTVGQWLRVPEYHLATVSNGKIFYDPTGQFTAVWKELRRGYPEDIRLKKLAVCCMFTAQAGQYNFLRLLKRRDRVGASLAKHEFIRGVVSLVYLINNQYMPYYKWMYYGMKRLPVLGKEMGVLIQLLTEAEGKDESLYYIEEICSKLIGEFCRQNITDAKPKENFLAVHGASIHRHIKNPGLRNTDPWMRTWVLT